VTSNEIEFQKHLIFPFPWCFKQNTQCLLLCLGKN